MLTTEVIYTFTSLVTAYTLLHLDSVSFFILKNSLFSALIMIGLVPVMFTAWRQARGLSREFFRYRFLSAFIGGVGDLAGLFIIASFGIVVSILIGFFGTVVRIVLSLVLLREYPTRRDIVSVVIISALVGAGIYLR